jgi:hypothetical protein
LLRQLSQNPVTLAGYGAAARQFAEHNGAFTSALALWRQALLKTRT